MRTFKTNKKMRHPNETFIFVSMYVLDNTIPPRITILYCKYVTQI